MKTKCLFANPRLSRLFDHFLSVRERASLEVNFGEERNSIRLHTPNNFLTVSQRNVRQKVERQKVERTNSLQSNFSQNSQN